MRTPLKMLPNRVWRSYLGGKLIDNLCGVQPGEDVYFPEDWLASVVEATNPDRDDKPEREGLSIVESDGNEKTYLKDLVLAEPEAFLGAKHIEKFGKNLGMLVKFLDAAQRLPIQVHPDKATARELFNSEYGKTEAWYILGGREVNGEPPYILLGFKKDVTREQWKELFDAQDVQGMEDCLHKLYVKPGEVYIIDGGTPHAIGAGCFLLEVQEPTDYTISMEKKNLQGDVMPDFFCHMGVGFEKMFDCFHYGAMTEKELLDAFSLTPKAIDSADGYSVDELIPYSRTPFFGLKRFNIAKSYTMPYDGRAAVLAVTKGKGTILCDGKEIVISQGDCLFVPAKSNGVILTANETLEVLQCIPPML